LAGVQPYENWYNFLHNHSSAKPQKVFCVCRNFYALQHQFMKTAFNNQYTAALSTHATSGRPSAPVCWQRQVVTDRKVNDPSSCCRSSARYPIPSFFDYRAKGSNP